jgi:LacI family transcriptional regulator
VNVLDCAIANGISVPAEVGILGTNDNIIVCENQDITISSINPNFRDLAITACEMLDKMMESGEKENAFTYIPALGVSERESTAGAYEKSPLLKDILRFMADNISSAITVEEIAAKFSVSESKLHRLFRDEMKTTPLAELRSLRFNKAKSLLRTTDFTLDFIANATGFLHPPHLVNAFRSSVGLTPAEWRRLWK